MSRFESFPRKENKPRTKKRTGSRGGQGAGNAIDALLTFSTLGMLTPPRMGKRKNKK